MARWQPPNKYFIGMVGRKTEELASQVLALIIIRLPVRDRVLAALDDRPTKRYGPKVEGACNAPRELPSPRPSAPADVETSPSGRRRPRGPPQGPSDEPCIPPVERTAFPSAAPPRPRSAPASPACPPGLPTPPPCHSAPPRSPQCGSRQGVRPRHVCECVMVLSKTRLGASTSGIAPSRERESASSE